MSVSMCVCGRLVCNLNLYLKCTLEKTTAKVVNKTVGRRRRSDLSLFSIHVYHIYCLTTSEAQRLIHVDQKIRGGFPFQLRKRRYVPV